MNVTPPMYEDGSGVAAKAAGVLVAGVLTAVWARQERADTASEKRSFFIVLFYLICKLLFNYLNLSLQIVNPPVVYANYGLDAVQSLLVVGYMRLELSPGDKATRY